MEDNFSRCMKPVLVHEGGKCDDPRDPGGRTNQGVIQRVYDGFRRNRNLPKRDVYLMDDAERDAIYKLQYWDAIRGDDLPAGVSYVVFDGAVNSGPGQSVKWLQRALGLPVVDGKVGEATIAACWAHPNHDELVSLICHRRILFLMQLRTWKTYGKGWTARVNDVKRRGQLWANGGTGALVASYFMGGEQKAPIESAETRPSAMAGDAATGGGVATGSVGGVLESVRETLNPLAGSSVAIERLVIALIVLGMLCTVGGVVYSRYQRHKQCKRADALDLPVPDSRMVEA